MPVPNVFMTPEEALFVARLGLFAWSEEPKLLEAAQKCTEQFGRPITVEDLHVMIVEAPAEAKRAVNLARIQQAKEREAKSGKLAQATA